MRGSYLGLDNRHLQRVLSLQRIFQLNQEEAVDLAYYLTDLVRKYHARTQQVELDRGERGKAA